MLRFVCIFTRYPSICASFCMHFYNRILRSVLRFVCIFITVSSDLCFVLYAFLQGVGLVKEIRISQGKLTKHIKKTRNYGHRKSQGKVKEKCADEQTTKMPHVAQVPRARSVESSPKPKMNQKPISRAIGIHITLKCPILLKHRARAVLRARQNQK